MAYVDSADLAGTGVGQGASMVGAQEGGTVQDVLLGHPRPFESFLPSNYDYTNQDCSADLEDAWTWSTSSGRPVSFAKRYLIENAAVLEGSGSFIFEHARFDVRDDGDLTTVFGTTKARAGLIVRNAFGAKITGFASFIGKNTELGVTHLVGAIFYKCRGMKMLAHLHFENMGEGRMVIYCNEAEFGDVSGKNLFGRQPFDAASTDTAGTVDVIYGCVDSRFGGAFGEQIFKPIRYMSVGSDENATTTSNTRLHVGPTSGTGRDGSNQSSILSVRCAKDCYFGPVSGSNVSNGLLIVRYGSDSAYSLDRNVFAGVAADSVNSSAEVDAVLQINSAGLPVGSNHICSVTGSGAIWGALVNGGTTRIDSVDVRAATPMQLYGAAIVDFGRVRIGGQSTHALIYDGVKGYIEHVAIVTGSATTSAHGVFNYGGGANADVTFGVIEYSGVSGGINHVFVDTHASPETVRVHNVVGTGSAGKAYWKGAFKPNPVSNGKLFATAAPATGAWNAAAIVYNASPTTSGAWAWVCVSGGSPGTWAPINM